MLKLHARAQAEFIYYVYNSYKNLVEKYDVGSMKKSSDCLNYAIRGLDKVLGANYASKKVLENNNIEDLKGATWDKKDKFNAHFEHAYTVSTMRRELIENNFTKNEAIDFILNNYACCWLTKEENTRLREAGFNSKRPNGWIDAYKSVGIEHVYLENNFDSFD